VIVESGNLPERVGLFVLRAIEIPVLEGAFVYRLGQWQSVRLI
jgi:hypothetical protein